MYVDDKTNWTHCISWLGESSESLDTLMKGIRDRDDEPGGLRWFGILLRVNFGDWMCWRRYFNATIWFAYRLLRLNWFRLRAAFRTSLTGTRILLFDYYSLQLLFARLLALHYNYIQKHYTRTWEDTRHRRLIHNKFQLRWEEELRYQHCNTAIYHSHSLVITSQFYSGRRLPWKLVFAQKRALLSLQSADHRQSKQWFCSHRLLFGPNNFTHYYGF